MSTIIRPEVSEKNQYWISKHRYYELKHFCMQYPMWKRIYDCLTHYPDGWLPAIPSGDSSSVSDPVAMYISERVTLAGWIGLVERVAKETDEVLGNYILQGITEGIPYDCLRAKTDIPCCKDVYYDLYRRFFWLLSKERQ